MIRLREALEPNIKVGTVVQAYGFPILSGFKGENFYKITRIEGETVYFQRSNQDGQIGNIGLGEFSANIQNVKDAIKSVESGTSTNGLRIWKENKQVLKEEADLIALLATLGVIAGHYALRKYGPYVLGKIFDGASNIANKISYIVNPDKWVKFLKELHKNQTFNKQFIDYIQKAGKDKAFAKLADKNSNIFEELPEFNKAIDKFIKDNDIPNENIEKLKNDIKSGFRNTIQYQAPKVIARLKSDYPELTQNLNEMIVSDKTDGRVKQMMLKIKSSYPSLNALNYDTQNKTYLFAFGKKTDADKLEKDFKAARSKNPNKAIGKFEFVRSADYPNDTPPTFVKQFKINETIMEAGNMLVYNINADAVTAFLRKYPKVRTVMTSIAKKNKDITKGYKEFLRFKDKHETELGGRGEIRKSDTFGEKQFYKYDWMGTTGWAEIYQFIHGAKIQEGTYENDKQIAIYDGEDGLTYIEKRGNGYYGYNDEFDFVADNKAELEKKLKSWGYRLISGSIKESVKEAKITIKKYNPITFSVEIDSEFGKSTVTTKTKEEADKIKTKLEKAFKAGKINSPASINHFAHNESVNEVRGPKLIQKEFDKVVGEIETTLAAYKKAKGTPKEKPLIAKLKELNDRKKSLAAELEDRISGLYKDAELKMSEAYLYPKGKSLKPGFQKTTFDINKMLKYAKSWKSFYDDFKRKFSSYPKDNQSLADLKDLFGMYHPELAIAEGIEGGNAEGLGLRAIAKMHNFDINDLLQQFKKGVKTEMEHTDKPEIAKEITLDHLVEDPLYYEKIQKIGL